MSTVKPTSQPVSNRVIQSFWTGPITNMERLCIKSYLDNGHEFHLYTYESLTGLPVGVKVKDANEIIPREQMEKFSNPQQFSDHFRYSLLFKLGGWWMDMDTVCLRPFTFSQEYVFALAPTSGTYLYNGFLKVPAESPIMQYCMQRTHGYGKHSLAALSFQDLGPTPLILCTGTMRWTSSTPLRSGTSRSPTPFTSSTRCGIMATRHTTTP